uniref:NTF2 domain-containing protein n=1 Tax=Lotharella oceanica TaxID=641309 RepID=A0A7S2U4N2_9EUKA
MSDQQDAKLAQEFSKYLFGQIDSKNYEKTKQLFRPQSVMSFEGNNCQGPDKIVGLLKQWNQKYPQTKHEAEADCLPLPDGSKLLLLTGRRMDKDHPNKMKGVLVVCAAVLKKDKNWWVSNMIYRGEANGKNCPVDSLKIGVQFAEHFYKTYDGNHRQLAQAYSDHTIMKYEKDVCKGTQQIMIKLTKGLSDKWEEQKKSKLPFRSVQFETVKHDLRSIDLHPAGGKGCIMIMTTGKIAPDGSQQGCAFGEVLVIHNNNGWKVAVQGFRQIY